MDEKSWVSARSTPWAQSDHASISQNWSGPGCGWFSPSSGPSQKFSCISMGSGPLDSGKYSGCNSSRHGRLGKFESWDGGVPPPCLRGGPEKFEFSSVGPGTPSPVEKAGPCGPKMSGCANEEFLTGVLERDESWVRNGWPFTQKTTVSKTFLQDVHQCSYVKVLVCERKMYQPVSVHLPVETLRQKNSAYDAKNHQKNFLGEKTENFASFVFRRIL